MNPSTLSAPCSPNIRSAPSSPNILGGAAAAKSTSPVLLSKVGRRGGIKFLTLLFSNSALFTMVCYLLCV